MTEEFYDKENIALCEQEWNDSKKHYSIAELAEIFPETEQILKEKILETLKDLKYCYQSRFLEIKNKERERYYYLLRLAKELNNSPDRTIKEYIVTQEIIPLEENFKRLQWNYINLTQKKEEKSIDVEELKSRYDLREVAEQYGVKLQKRSSKDWTGKCPFHKDDTPSFSVSERLYYCFGCGKSGDLINFIQEIENCDFKEAIKKLQ